jgi:hypothetical protein
MSIKRQQKHSFPTETLKTGKKTHEIPTEHSANLSKVYRNGIIGLAKLCAKMLSDQYQPIVISEKSL